MNRSEGNAPALSGFTQQWRFIVKELRETLRDRRTIITLLAMPLLVYPLLGIGFRFIALRQAAITAPTWRIGGESEGELAWLKSVLQYSDSLMPDDEQTSAPPDIQYVGRQEGNNTALVDIVAAGDADVGIRVELKERVEGIELTPADIEIIENDGSPVSRIAADYIQQRLKAMNLSTVTRWGRQFDRDFRVPLRYERSLVRPQREVHALLGFMPLVLLLMTVTGGVYPAIDLTAGERERDTLETLMALPVPKFRLIAAKFAAVVTVTILTGLVNLAAMSATVYALQLETTLFGSPGMTLSLLLRLILVLFAFAIFYSSVLLIITSSVRSFKEAQAYLIPLLLLSIAPGLVILLPGWELNLGTAVLPMINMLLMVRGVFERSAELLPSVVAVVSTFSYATICLMLAAQVFGTDAVTTGSGGRWDDLLQRPTSALDAPTPACSLAVLALLFPLHFVATGLLARAAEMSIAARFTASAVLTVILFVVVPMLFAMWQRVRVFDGFRIRPTTLKVWPGVLLLGVAVWPLVFETVILLQNLGLRSIDAARFEQVEELLTAWVSIPLPVRILVFGVLPGLCEELFFRGYLFSGLRNHFSGMGTVLICGLAFGTFHVILAAGAAPERFVPSTIMGLLLGWVALRTNSVLPCVALHVCHNSLLLAITDWRDELAGWGIGVASETHLPPVWLAISAICVVAGIATVHLATRTAILRRSETGR